VSKNALTYIEAVVIIAAIAIPVHYLGGIDVPWAIVIGAAGSIAVRWLVHRAAPAGPRKPPLEGGR
jgi:hypothetical protein